MMYGVQILLLVLAVRTGGYASNNALCDYSLISLSFSQLHISPFQYIFQKCHRDVNNNNMIGYNSSMLDYCGIENIPSEINFTMMENLTDYLKIEFKFPEVECRYGVALLVNSSIKDGKECAKHRFEEGDISTKIHTPERTLCVHRNTDQLITYNDNSTVSSCKGIIKLWFQHIFTGCYALRFRIGREKHVITGHKFVNTTYKHTEVVEPQFTCKYNIYSNINSSNELVNLTLDTSLPVDTGLLLILMLISNYEEDSQKPCIWNGTPIIGIWKVNLVNNTMKNCSVNTILTTTGEHVKIVQCNFQIKAVAEATGYCFIFNIEEKRCHKNTFWKPPENANVPCTWIKRCTRTFASLLHIEKTNVMGPDKLNTSLYLSVVVIVLLVSAIIGMLCFFLSNLHVRNEEINLYVNPQQDDFTKSICLESADLNVTNNDNEKTIDRNIHAYNEDIILVYTKSFVLFMALMKDFRETLSKLCSCSVHDWHDGAEWNDVARVGPVLWFTELLNSGCRVIWIDTPATRSIVKSNFKDSDDSDSSKLNKYYEISDFRDMEFPVVLELAKRNIKDPMFQYRKHFVVRFKGLESSENMNDPFLDLSPHARYLMPQHLAQLCSDLSEMKSPVISTYEMKTEEDMLQQHLTLMKMESIM